MILDSNIYELRTSAGRSRIVRNHPYWKLEATTPEGVLHTFRHKDLRTVQAQRKAFHDGQFNPQT
jgi:hypothetical protein